MNIQVIIWSLSGYALMYVLAVLYCRDLLFNLKFPILKRGDRAKRCETVIPYKFFGMDFYWPGGRLPLYADTVIEVICVKKAGQNDCLFHDKRGRYTVRLLYPSLPVLKGRKILGPGIFFHSTPFKIDGSLLAFLHDNFRHQVTKVSPEILARMY